MNTVAIYTQVGIKALKDLHQVMHPAASVATVKGARGEAEISAEDRLDALDAEAGDEEA